MINLEKYNIIDISMQLKNDVITWPGTRHNFKHYYALNMDNGDHANVSRIETSMHTGTHLDAPFHKLNNGEKLHDIPEKNFMGVAQVIDLSSVEKLIELQDIKNKIHADVEIILLKTLNSNLLSMRQFENDYVCLDANAAKYLAEKKIKAICVDYLSIDEFDSKNSINHKIFLEKNILIYEAVNLLKVKEGKYFFIGLPIKIDNADAALVRAILLEER